MFEPLKSAYAGDYSDQNAPPFNVTMELPRQARILASYQLLNKGKMPTNRFIMSRKTNGVLGGLQYPELGGAGVVNQRFTSQEQRDWGEKQLNGLDIWSRFYSRVNADPATTDPGSINSKFFSEGTNSPNSIAGGPAAQVFTRVLSAQVPRMYVNGSAHQNSHSEEIFHGQEMMDNAVRRGIPQQLVQLQTIDNVARFGNIAADPHEHGGTFGKNPAIERVALTGGLNNGLYNTVDKNFSEGRLNDPQTLRKLGTRAQEAQHSQFLSYLENNPQASADVKEQQNDAVDITPLIASFHPQWEQLQLEKVVPVQSSSVAGTGGGGNGGENKK